MHQGQALQDGAGSAKLRQCLIVFIGVPVFRCLLGRKLKQDDPALQGLGALQGFVFIVEGDEFTTEAFEDREKPLLIFSVLGGVFDDEIRDHVYSNIRHKLLQLSNSPWLLPLLSLPFPISVCILRFKV